MEATRDPVMGFVLATVALAACFGSRMTSSDGISPVALRSGVYPLRAYHAKSVPAEIGTLGPKSWPGDTIPRNSDFGCRVLVTGGALALDVEAMRYSYWYESRNACNQRVLSKPTLDGTFEQHGNDLVFHIHLVDGDRTFGGSVGPSSITVDIGSLLEFQR